MGVVVIMREPLKLVYSRTGDVPHPIARGLTNPKHLKQKKSSHACFYLYFSDASTCLGEIYKSAALNRVNASDHLESSDSRLHSTRHHEIRKST